MGHFFIIYTYRDERLVAQVRATLEHHGIRIWETHEHLIPQSPEWLLANKQGITEAQAILYMGSPNVVNRPRLLEQLEIVWQYQRPLIGVWIEGDHWTSFPPYTDTARIVDVRAQSMTPATLPELLDALDWSQCDMPTRQMPPTVVGDDDHSDLPATLIAKGFLGTRAKATALILPPMVTIPAGPFFMGSTRERDPLAFGIETPPVAVPIFEAYDVGQYPVTVAEYACFLAATQHRPPPDMVYSAQLGMAAAWEGQMLTWALQQTYPDHPVVGVSWRDAVAYTHWLSDHTPYQWRLLTEAEWEKAARGTDGRIYPWGDEWDPERVNTREHGPRRTTPVGSYLNGGSPYGCQDMSGNVKQWTSTFYKNIMPFSTFLHDRVLKGCSWEGYRAYARVAWRDHLAATALDYLTGFRLARQHR